MAGFTCEHLGKDTETGEWICGVAHTNPSGMQEVQVKLPDINSEGMDVLLPGEKTIYQCKVFNLFNARMMRGTIVKKCAEASVVPNQGGFKMDIK